MGSGRRKIDWKKWDDLLGSMSDTKLANKISVTTSAVQARRNELGIPPYGAIPNPDKWKCLDRLLGKVSDALVAEIAGCTKAYVAKRRRNQGLQSTPEVSAQVVEDFLKEIPEEEQNGTMASAIARITAIRNEPQGLAAFKGKKVRFERAIYWEKWDEQLGMLPDKELGEKIDCPA